MNEPSGKYTDIAPADPNDPPDYSDWSYEDQEALILIQARVWRAVRGMITRGVADWLVEETLHQLRCALVADGVLRIPRLGRISAEGPQGLPAEISIEASPDLVRELLDLTIPSEARP